MSDFTHRGRASASVALAVLLLGTLLLLTACGTTADKTSTPANSTTAKKPQLPGSFPHNFPKPEGGRLLAAKYNLDENGETVNWATWEIKQTATEVVAAYKRDLVANGWQIISVTGTDEPDIAFTKSGDPGESHIKVVTVQGKLLLQVLIY